MTWDNIEDGWYRASSVRATFAFEVMLGSVVSAPPYGWKLLGGKSALAGVRDLLNSGFTIERIAKDEQ